MNDQQKLFPFSNKFLLISFLIIGLLIAAIVVLFILILNKTKSNPKIGLSSTTTYDSSRSKHTQDFLTSPSEKMITPMPLPKIEFISWTDQSVKPQLAPNPRSFSLKQNYTVGDVKKIAQTLGITNSPKSYGPTVLVYSLGDKNSSFIVFDSASGKFSFASTLGLDLINSSFLKAKVYQLLKNLGLYDETLTITATYKRKSQPG